MGKIRREALVGNVLGLACAGLLGLAHCGSDEGPAAGAPDAGRDTTPGPSPTSTGGGFDGAPNDAAGDAAIPVTPVAPLWTLTFGGGGAFEIAVMPDGDAVIAASEYANGGPEDILVVKVTPAGVVVWEKRFGGTGQDQCVSIGVGDGGDVFISGKLGSASVDFGGGVVVSGLTNGKEYGYVARLDGATGAGKWARVFRATGTAYVDQVAVRDGHVAIGGRFDGTLTYDPVGSGGGGDAGADAGAPQTVSPFGSRNAMFASIDAATGYVRWLRAVSTDGSGSYSEGLAVADNGDVFGGLTFSNDSLQGLGAPRAPIGAVDLVLFRLADADGSPTWVKQFANAQTKGIANPSRLSFAGSGPLLFAGGLRGELDFGLGPLVSPAPDEDRGAAFLAMEPTNGTATFQRAHAFPKSTLYGKTMRDAPNGDRLVAATYQDPSSNNVPPLVVVEGHALPDPTDGSGSYAIRYDATGAAKWVRAVVPVAGTQNNPSVFITDIRELPSGPLVVSGTVFGKGDLGNGNPIEGVQGASKIVIWAWPP